MSLVKQMLFLDLYHFVETNKNGYGAEKSRYPIWYSNSLFDNGMSRDVTLHI